jgi:hypothetical protein
MLILELVVHKYWQIWQRIVGDLARNYWQIYLKMIDGGCMGVSFLFTSIG